MPEILRVKINWTGFIGSPGYSNLYFSEFVETGYTQAHAQGAVDKASSFAGSIREHLPVVVNVAVDPVVDIVQADTGQLVGFFTTVPTFQGNGIVTGSYSAASGACVSWGTSNARNGRRVRGRTFIVPLGGSTYDTNGTIGTTPLANLNTYANALIANTGVTDFGVWARPTSPTATDGQWFPATSAAVKDKVAVLRSRRD